jgi:ABC-2 type transport system permease protein
MNRLFSLRRLLAIIAKEAIQMRRDRITFAMMLGVPLMQLVLFGFAINNDPKGLPAALVTTSQDHYTRAMVSAMENTGYYRFDHVVESAQEADRLIRSGEVSFVVTIPSDFARRVVRGDNPQILIEADATDPSVASGAISTLGTVAAQALLREQSAEALAARQSTAALQVVVHQLYNPEGITQYNIVPGLLGVILQLTMVMMTSMALTREAERGTMENLLAMPTSPIEIMLGKVLPYLAVGAVQVVVVLGGGQVPVQCALCRILVAVDPRHPGIRAGAGAAWLCVLHCRPHPDAGHAADLLFLPAVASAVGLHVSLPRNATLGAAPGRDISLDAFPQDHPRGDAQGRGSARL